MVSLGSLPNMVHEPQARSRARHGHEDSVDLCSRNLWKSTNALAQQIRLMSLLQRQPDRHGSRGSNEVDRSEAVGHHKGVPK